MFGTDAYAPLQIYQLNLPGVSCQRKAPTLALQDYIYYYWVLRMGTAQVDLEVIPDNAIDLVLSPEIDGFSVLYFPTAEKFTIPLTGPVVYVGVSIKTEHAADILGFELSILKSFSAGQETTTSIDLSTLVTEIQGCTDTLSMFTHLDDFWQQRLPKSRPSQVKIQANMNHERWLDAIQQSLGYESLQTIAANVGLSERQFRRISTHLFGLSPKKIQRVLRLQAAIRELLSADTLAIENLYYDDSHRIKELKKLTGLTPGSIRKMAEIYNLTV